MSELKGTLLGIVLVLILFGSVSVCLKGAFDKMTDAVTEEVNETVEELSPSGN